MAMLQRAFARAQIRLCYTEGFNPRPRFSLPLPRNVGMLSDAELMYAVLCSDESSADPEQIKDRICGHVPQGCEIYDTELIEGRVRYRPVSVVYVFSLAGMDKDGKIRANIESLRRSLEAGKGLIVERASHGTKPARKTDVSAYIDSISAESGDLVVRCNITGAGTVRADEILELLQIDSSQISRPVRRKSVRWKCN
jgi:radical SAM-linked protein